MAIPIIYNIRSLKERPVSTALTAVGMGLVVVVFVAMLALATGFRAALTSTGSRDNVLVLRKGADTELSSGLSREVVNIVSAMPFIALGTDGRALVSPEIYVVLSLERLTGGLANVVARGVSLKALEVRKGVKIVDGRMLNPGAPEIIVGHRLADRFANCRVGDRLTFGSREWTVVGHFTADGSAFESEIWGENEQFMPVFRGQVFQSLALRLKDPSAFPGVKQALEADVRLQVDAHREYEFYQDQSSQLGAVLRFVGIFISSIMAVGAVFGAVNTMYAAVASRSPEIAILKTLGFPPGSILSSFLMEAVLLALLGGLIGCLLSLPLNGIVTSTTNFQSFSEVAFAFRITPALLIQGIGFAVVMGLVGGFFPARRAAKQQVIESLRQG